MVSVGGEGSGRLKQEVEDLDQESLSLKRSFLCVDEQGSMRVSCGSCWLPQDCWTGKERLQQVDRRAAPMNSSMLGGLQVTTGWLRCCYRYITCMAPSPDA